MAIDLKFRAQIERPVDVVCAAVTDLPNMSKWFSVKEIRNISAGPLEVGTRFQIVTEVMGKDRVVDYTVTEYDGCRRFAYQSEGFFASTITMQLEPVEAGESTSLLLQFQVNVSRLIAPVVKGQLRQQMPEDLSRLVEYLENEA